jgi:hypothetical protein
MSTRGFPARPDIAPNVQRDSRRIQPTVMFGG